MDSLIVKLFLYAAVVSLVNGQTDRNCTSTSSTGKHFMIAVPESYSTPDKIVLHITSAVNKTRCTIKAPDVHFDQTYTFGNYIQVNMSYRIMQLTSSSSLTAKKGIKISCDHACALHVLPHDSSDSVEGFLALPVNALGTRYVISSYTPLRSGTPSEFVIAGVENNTRIHLSKKIYYNGYSNSSLTLNEFDTYIYKNSRDLSDSVISSDKPISVFSADIASQVPHGSGDLQYIVEQMIPTKFWAKTFIVPHIYPRKYSMYRIYGTKCTTSVTRHNGNITGSTVIKSNHFENTASDTTVIIADKAISVIQYGYDVDDMDGDPFMTTVQAVSQFQNSYEFVTDFDKMPFNNIPWPVTLVITARTSDISEILLDGSNSYIQAHSHIMSVPPPMADFSIYYINMTYDVFGSFHTLRHAFGKPFGATIYSLPGIAAAYGYPLKFALKDQVCQIPTTTSTTTTTTMTTKTKTTTTTSPPTTKPTTTITTTDIFATTTSETQVIYYNNTTQSTGGLQCFDCRDIQHLRYCDKVTRCSGNEVCYVESYTKPHGQKMYRSGCIDKGGCQPLGGTNDCLQCCASRDFCNMDGCEEAQSSISSGTRGPYCYDCSHIGDNEKCTSGQMCPSDQVCMIEKYVWGNNDFNYVMGCIRPHVCEAKKRSVLDRKLTARHAPVCTHCCSTDFCNKNCTHHYSPGLIG